MAILNKFKINKIQQAQKNIEIAEKNLAEAKEALNKANRREVRVGDVFKSNSGELYWVIVDKGCVVISGETAGDFFNVDKNDSCWQTYQYIGRIDELLNFGGI